MSGIIQFGTSRFLQAHVDLFVHEARVGGQQVGAITVVQTSASPDRAGRVGAFNAPGGFAVIIRGMENGAAVERRVMVESVARGLAAAVDWADTLVDRIVSEALEPIGAVAEPYAVWVIERRPGLVLPCEHPCIIVADDLEPFERLKLHILNLGHTVLADIWRREARPGDETVRAILADPAVRGRLDAVYRDEVVPGFAVRGMRGEAEAYVGATMERFLNPFLAHRIADIAQNHAAKVERRIAAFLGWVGDGLAAPVLQDIVSHQG